MDPTNPTTKLERKVTCISVRAGATADVKPPEGDGWYIEDRQPNGVAGEIAIFWARIPPAAADPTDPPHGG